MSLLTAATIATSLVAPAAVHAQAAWPTKTVTIIVPNGPGSGADVAARLLAEALGKTYRQTFVVDNRAGANGMLGTQAAAKAPNDGYTLLLTYAAAQVVNQSLYPKAGYDGDKDFAAIAQIGAGGNLLVVPADLPVKDMSELIAYVKSKPANSLSYGSWGNGSGGHLNMEALKQQTGLTVQHIPYKTPAASVTDLVGGQIQMAFSPIPPALPLIQGGKIKAIAVSGPYRVPQVPEVRTMTEQGVKFDLVAWYGLFAPAGTPPAVVNSLNNEVLKLLANPDVLEAWKKALGLSAFPIKTPEQFSQTVKEDIRAWGATVKAGNIKVE